MKKEYFNPTTEIVMIETEQILSDSDPDTGPGLGGGPGSEAAGAPPRRDFSVWDDDDEANEEW